MTEIVTPHLTYTSSGASKRIYGHTQYIMSRQFFDVREVVTYDIPGNDLWDVDLHAVIDYYPFFSVE